MPKKILITYANAGSGHRKSAEAVEKAVNELTGGRSEVKTIDALDYSASFFKKAYPSCYIFMVNHSPAIWGFGYYILDVRLIYSLMVAPLRRLNNSINCKGLVSFLKDFAPDICINTHFLGSEVMSHMKKGGLLSDTKLITSVTDYFMHSFWLNKYTDHYCVADEASRSDLEKRGVESSRIQVTGVPVDPVFGQVKGRENLCRKLGFNPERQKVLLAGGGFGVGPMTELAKALLDEVPEMELLTVCGKNDRLLGDMRILSEKSAGLIRAYGFVDNMDELMEVSDVMVTKSGGMTSSEALAKRLPLIITSAIPGQEARNRDFLLKAGVAVYAPSVSSVRKELASLIFEEGKLAKIRRRIDRIRRPRSAYKVAEFALSV